YITSSELEALKKQHEKQMKELQEENEILKKAMHIFSKRHM
ncbi:transposase, partial [Rossellomorea marisflavi]